jgi:hypothetical protein
MSDIVERLRVARLRKAGVNEVPVMPFLNVLRDAADAIERLERERGMLREALTSLLSICEAGDDPFKKSNYAVVKRARAALEAKP